MLNGHFWTIKDVGCILVFILSKDKRIGFMITNHLLFADPFCEGMCGSCSKCYRKFQFGELKKAE